MHRQLRFEGAPFRLSLKSMPLAKIICKRHFHMSGEMALNTPLPTRHAHSPFATAQGAPCQKRGFGAARYQVAREARFRATIVVVLSAMSKFFLDFLCGSRDPKIDASNQSARVCIANSARFFILAIFGFPGVLPFPRGIFCSALALRRGSVHRFNFDVSFVKKLCQLFYLFIVLLRKDRGACGFVAASVLDHAGARKTQTRQRYATFVFGL